MVLTCKTTLGNLTIGDYVWCKYVALSSSFGTFSELATKTDLEVTNSLIPIASTATPNGYFKFILVGYDRLGRKKLVADRNIQHSITWDTLNTAGIASGSGLPIKIDGKDGFTIRLMTGGVSSTDKDNEWDKIIAESTLGGLITAGDNSVWNWLNSYTWSSTSTTLSNRVMRGYALVNSFTVNSTTGANAGYSGFRPVLLIEESTSKTSYCFVDEEYRVYAYDGTTLIKVADDLRTVDAATKKSMLLAANTVIPPQSVLSGLGKYKTIGYSEEPIVQVTQAKLTAVPHDQLVAATSDISLTGVDNIDKFTLIAHESGSGRIYSVASPDNGQTWYSYNSGTWTALGSLTAANVVAGGMRPSDLNACTDWEMFLTAKKIRFAYVLSIGATTDLADTDKLSSQWDLNGYYEGAVPGADFKYRYKSNSELEVEFLTANKFKVNY